ncbi:hypothetical protein ACFX2G_003881 [Malus domestica]
MSSNAYSLTVEETISDPLKHLIPMNFAGIKQRCQTAPSTSVGISLMKLSAFSKNPACPYISISHVLLRLRDNPVDIFHSIARTSTLDRLQRHSRPELVAQHGNHYLN